MSSDSDSNASIPEELDSDQSSEGKLGYGEESGENDYDEEMEFQLDEEGEEESEEDISQKAKKVDTAAETGEEEVDDDVVDEDQLATNIESKRDDAIRKLLAKEDLGII